MPRRALDLFAAFTLVACFACTRSPSLPSPSGVADSRGRAPQSLELVESWPLETSLDHRDVRDAKDVWPELIDAARARLDFAEFYASDNPAGASALTPVVVAVERAAARGVKVRWLADAKFARTYPELLDRFARAGVDVRRFDVAKTMGGVLHAKYFIADDVAYIGSQNFDWRSLEHIQELGLRIEIPEVVHALADVFELDWSIAAGASTRDATSGHAAPSPFPVHTDAGEVTFVASPTGWLPGESRWELPALVKMIDSAAHSVRVQLLTYRAHGGHGGDFPELEAALQRASARGVKVELLVSDWTKRKGTVEGLQALVGPSFEVKFLDVPAFSSGYIPFARVAHAKYLVVDGARAWVGTSNWERDYFFASRNVGVVMEGGPIPARLDAFFASNWGSPYAEPVDPARAYTPPRMGE